MTAPVQRWTCPAPRWTPPRDGEEPATVLARLREWEAFDGETLRSLDGRRASAPDGLDP
ncbi:hypothetical protein [Streptomyces sp. SID2888]|uniref:hypothetical protein n=1 Tax=Streptomyces sp. SID2888 TaxID=2690256 RepID=UPI0013688D10|nr:hypothetical protein [Streptomyces sp. SID2888]MYV49081.1 hypothetical protein [Streptomyces sp. SID2888]